MSNTKKQEAAVLIAVGIAFIAAVGHHIACVNSGTVLRAANLVFSLMLLAFILAGCLFVMARYRYVTWKNVLFLSLAVVFLVLFKIVLYLPEVIARLSLPTHVALVTVHVFLQVVVFVCFVAMAKRRPMEGDSSEV